MLILSLLACRIEVGNQAQTQGPSEGPVELWVYTSMYQSVLDELDPIGCAGRGPDQGCKFTKFY